MPSYSLRTIRQHFRRADRATTTADKGKALEDLACYLFEKVPGLSLSQRNVKNVYDTEEIDVSFWNEQYPSGLKSLDAVLLVECKNWSNPVGSIEVNWFLTKIQNRSLDFGILIAANGITGNTADKKEAHDVVSKALARGIRMVLLTRDEIENLKSSGELVTLIKQKICQLVVTGTVWP